MGIIVRVARAIIGRPRPLRCTGCGRDKTAIERLVSGPHVYICERCHADAAERLAETPPSTVLMECSFCGKTGATVPLRADRRHGICGECVALVGQILLEAASR